MSLYFTYMVPEVVTAICERPYCIMTLIFKNRCIWAIRGGLHKDIAQCKSRVPVARWMVKREGKAAQRGLFKKEMDRGGEQGANIPLQQARDSASICTPRSLSHIHHSLTAPTSRFHLTSRYPHPFLPNLSREGVQMGFSSFLSTQDVIHLGWQSIFCCITRGREHVQRRGLAAWVDGS